MYQEIASNKRKTFFLMMIFALFIIGIGIVFGASQGNPYLFIIPAVFISISTTLIGYFNADKLVLGISHAKQINTKHFPEIFHLVENLCITAGLKTIPKIYVIDDPAPNAFATGRDPAHSTIAITTGLIKKLNKSELEGVLAHELSHILNYDIRLQTMIVVFVGIIALMSDLFIRFSFYGSRHRRSSSNKSGGITIILILIGIILAILSPIVAKIIQLAISRKREYLADASGALLTRYPEGLAKALEKIAHDPHPLRAINKVTAHLYIYNPLQDHKRSFLSNMFSTHPPTIERVKRLRAMGH